MDSPLTVEATEAICKLQNLRGLSVFIEKGTPIPLVSLPNLIRLKIKCEDGSDGLRLLRGATPEYVDFNVKSKPDDDFLEAFKEAALFSSAQDMLSTIHLATDWSWNPNYSSLLPFTRLVDLVIIFSCDDDCSGVDDDTLIGLSRAMPNLKHLCLGADPCGQFTGGATARGLLSLARNCPKLSTLRVHFQAASLSDPPAGLETTRNVGYSASSTDCALTWLDAGDISVPEGSVPIIALTLLRIFPRIETIDSWDDAWEEVVDLIYRSKEIVDCSSKYHLTITRDSSLSLLGS